MWKKLDSAFFALLLLCCLLLSARVLSGEEYSLVAVEKLQAWEAQTQEALSLTQNATERVAIYQRDFQAYVTLSDEAVTYYKTLAAASENKLQRATHWSSLKTKVIFSLTAVSIAELLIILATR